MMKNKIKRIIRKDKTVPPSAESVKGEPLTEEILVKKVVGGIESLAEQTRRKNRAEIEVGPHQFNLPYFPVHATALEEERWEELERNLAAYRKVVNEVDEVLRVPKHREAMAHPLIFEEATETGGSIRRIYTRIGHRTGYLIEQIEFDAQDTPIDYDATVKIPVSYVEEHDMKLNESDRTPYIDRFSQWRSYTGDAKNG